MCERTLHPPHLSIDSIALSKASFHFYATLANYLIGYFQLYAGRKSFSLWDDTLLLLAGSCTENQLNAGVLRVGGWFITAPQRDNYSGYLWICRETKETASVLCTLSVPHVYIDLVQKDLRIFAQIPSPAPWVVVRIYKGRAVADVMWLAGWLVGWLAAGSVRMFFNGVLLILKWGGSTRPRGDGGNNWWYSYIYIFYSPTNSIQFACNTYLRPFCSSAVTCLISAFHPPLNITFALSIWPIGSFRLLYLIRTRCAWMTNTVHAE